MAKFDTRQITEYRLRCEAMWQDDGSGCSGSGPSGYSESEARKLAEEDGWQLIEGTGWACPAHARARENAEAAEDQSQY